MSAALAAAREALADALDGVTTVHREFPSRLTPPCAVLLPGSPYVSLTEAELPHGFAYVRFAVLLVSKASLSTEARDVQLDTLAVNAAAALIDTDTWHPEQVDEPRVTEISGSSYLAARLTARAPVRIA